MGSGQHMPASLRCPPQLQGPWPRVLPPLKGTLWRTRASPLAWDMASTQACWVFLFTVGCCVSAPPILWAESHHIPCIVSENWWPPKSHERQSLPGDSAQLPTLLCAQSCLGLASQNPMAPWAPQRLGGGDAQDCEEGGRSSQQNRCRPHGRDG